ncbi:MAG: vitamin B12-dependent ribonucleotide reductase [Clostridiales bacterium]|jgi:ribonucleoside-diphosphate reductase alpha chain|nr:vitamin B12-dependent ribonucleotide reductase [Clostridiales bacterium]
MNISENARIVLEKRYLTKDENNKVIETPEQMFERVASAIASADLLYDEKADVKRTKQAFLDMMTNFEFLPNSPTLMNAGKPLGQLSACFVLPVEDSMEEIFETIKNAALIHKSGGGTGFSFSRLRSKGAPVRSTGGIASGPVSFMKVFNAATEAVKQGGTRRGANMGILRVDHPDILEFIDCKKDNSDITNFNISVGITEKFMEAVKKGEDYPLIDPNTKKEVGTLSAREVYDKIVRAAWTNGEPGIVFLDRLNKFNSVPTMGEIESTNPCGEQPLLPYESCNLGSINLSKMMKKVGESYEIDWDKLEATTRRAVHFLNNVIDVNKYPLDIIDKTTKKSRKIGLGVMGFADMLLRLKVPYNSEQAIETARRVMGFIHKKGMEESRNLAKKRGPFPLFSESIYKEGEPLRNATVTTIAPTGTLSIIAGCSSGVEPIFAYVFIRNVMDNTELVEVNPILKEELEKRGLYSGELMKKIAQQGTLAHIEELPQDIKEIFVSAHDILPEYHIRIQAAFQEFTDNAVSKTVNFKNSATVEDVDKVYKLAYELGCKGVTIYRDGSRESQVLNIGKVSDRKAQLRLRPRPRPEIVSGFTEKVKIGCGNLYITVNFDNQGIVEVFTNTGKAGGCPSQSEATARLVSISLRSGMDVETIIEQLKGIRCPSTIRQPGMKVTSCPDAIAKVIEKVVKIQQEANSNGKRVISELISETKELDEFRRVKFCPECGHPINHEGGCVVCRNCGYSKCG